MGIYQQGNHRENVMPLGTIQTPEAAVFNLTTLTPLYTGGIGQHGEQLHPSGLLGSIRHWSGLVARALGDRAFEERVWGNVNRDDTHAKQVAVRWDGGGLKPIRLPPTIEIAREDNKKSAWYFNQALIGNCQLTLTRQGISDADWLLLLLALRIQVRWATFGAKDQFGLGVLACEHLPQMDMEYMPPPPHAAIADSSGLHHAFLARLHFNGCADDMKTRLEQGLIWRPYLRNQFRKNGEQDLRHYLFGKLGKFGSAINISAAYPIDSQSSEIRIWGIIPHTDPIKFLEQYDMIMQRLQAALENTPDGFTNVIHTRFIEISPPSGSALLPWLAHLAGVNHA